MDITPFNVKFSPKQRDKNLYNRLLKELSGILNWALQGFLDWQQNGIGQPTEIRQTLKEYKVAQDQIENFISDCCITGSKSFSIGATALYESYCNWCQNADDYLISQRKFGETILEKGFRRTPGTNNKKVYWGITTK